jgi:hypothetical protein
VVLVVSAGENAIYDFDVDVVDLDWLVFVYMVKVKVPDEAALRLRHGEPSSLKLPP